MFDFDHYLPLGWQENGMVVRAMDNQVATGGKVARRGGGSWQAAILAPFALTFAIATTQIVVLDAFTSSTVRKADLEALTPTSEAHELGPWVDQDFWAKIEKRFANATRIREPDFSDDDPLI